MTWNRRWTRPPAKRTTLAAGAVAAALAAFACEGNQGNPMQPTPDVPARMGGQLVPHNDQPWTGLTANGWQYLRRASAKDDDIVTDATAPFSPPHVLRIVFTPGMTRDSEPSVHWIGLPRPREVYTDWWMKLSSNWSPSPAGAGKMTFLHAWPDGQGQVYTAFHGSKAPHWVIVNTEWAPYGQKIWSPNVTTTQIAYGRWYRFEWYVKWESAAGAGDGVLRWWVDGVRNGDYANVTFPAGGVGFQQFEFAPTLQNPPREEQYMYIDHTSVRTP